MGESTIAAIATGMTNSGIGVIRLSGNNSFNIAKELFRKTNGDRYLSFESHKVYYGYVFDDNSVVDEILLIAMKAPKSFTGEDVIEFQCHGGTYLLNKILDLVIKAGAKIAEPGEFSKRAFLNGRIDLTQAESLMDLISSKNEYTLNNSIKHLRGRLFNKICDIRKSILYEIAFIESALDDPEHYDLISYPEHLNIKICSILDDLKYLSNSFNDGKLIEEGINTVILGRPNVGKSSFLNMLSGSERAIVTEVAGTTRDTIEESVNIDGIQLNLIDTAGIHDSEDKVEKIGIDIALKKAENADFIIIIIDGSEKLSEEDIKIFEFVKNINKESVVLINKSDIDCCISENDIFKYITSKIISFSNKTEDGLDTLKNYIKKSFVNGFIKYNDEMFISNIRQKNQLDQAIESLNKTLNSIESGLPEDFFTIDMNDAYISLGLVIGEETSEDVVNEIFSKFCMGK